MGLQKSIACAAKKTVNLKEIGLLVRAARKAEELTQKQLADQMQVDVMTISQVENGSKRTGKAFLDKIAKHLGITFELTFPLNEE